MHKIITVLFTLGFLLNNSFTYAAIQTVESKRQWRAQIFIANQIKGIGLVDSYQEDKENRSYVYDNTLAAIASMNLGNFGLAKEILDTLCYEVKNTAQGVPFESYIYSDTNGNGSGLAYCGNSAWFLQALNIYQKLKTSTTYYTTQKKLADFLLTLQDPIDGGLRGNTYEYWKSTEHNIIAYVAIRNFGRLNGLSSYVSKADKIKKFLQSSAIWNGAYFNRGAWDRVKVIDVQALGVLLLGNNYSNALAWAETNLKLSRPFNSGTVTGFDFNDDLDTVWLEGTLQMALAFYRVGNTTKANYYYNEAIKTTQGDGALVLATNRGTASEWWMMEVWRAIAPTSWLILYYLKFNPLILY
ncbi:MAG: hypothetical protein HZA27_02225 [Candidatus Omnitrophica bacterium]|nr:hypothetical protein [Candidatus Omnitrophota bacterium]MBI5144983.1 hypothetical protein [Candidatus Omnitrophota bacterium]